MEPKGVDTSVKDSIILMHPNLLREHGLTAGRSLKFVSVAVGLQLLKGSDAVKSSYLLSNIVCECAAF